MGGRAGQDWLTGKLSLLGGRVGAMGSSRKGTGSCACAGRSWLGPCAPHSLAAQKPIDAAPRPHSPGSMPNTRALGTLLLLANHPTAAATAALARQACQAQHCKVTCSAWVRLGTAGAALGTTGCGTDGQCSPPQLCRKAGSPEAADHLPPPSPRSSRPPAHPPRPAPPPFLKGRSLGKQ